ncbi:MAG: alpha/beta hydrolase [Ferruginibacter sp.]
MAKNSYIRLFLVCIVAGYIQTPVVAQTDISRREKYLPDILKIIDTSYFRKNNYSWRVTPRDSTWMDWLKRTGELPPDFDHMPSIPFLPEPLVLNKDGIDIPIHTYAQWQEKRKWIKKEFQHWVSGTIPPSPGSFETTVLSDKMEGGTHIQTIVLRFGPGNKARMTLELMIPEGKGPFPVYLTQWNQRNWAQLAVRRGYIGCVYAAADDKDDTQDYQAFYPSFDFTALMRRAWGASRVVDYLLTLKAVNRDQIAITGHSRNGKQSLWAAAFDDRIAAVISSSCGTGGIAPWRYGDPQYDSETLDIVTGFNPQWFHPRLRFFFGREDKLPVDQNLLISLIAPRIVLFHYSTVEQELNPWSNEQCYQSVRKVFSFLGAEENLGIFPRMGEHEVASRDLERCIDFLDIRFHRKKIPWENKLYFDYSFDKWAGSHKADKIESGKIKAVKLHQSYADTTMFNTQKKIILSNLKWLLGKEPPGVKHAGKIMGTDGDWIDNITGRPKVSGAAVMYIGPYSSIGDNLKGMLYYPVDRAGNKVFISGGKMPVIIFLHQYSYGHGFAKGYSPFLGRGNDSLFQVLIDKGFAIMAIDMFGFGTRMEEAQYFYERFPEWSKMGKMVSDVSPCVDALETFDFIDSRHIFLLGNTIGGSVALMAAARDERIAGVAVVAAISPWRTSNRNYESLRTYSHLHGFLPRLGLFAGNPRDVPVDFGEIISCIAPRPLMIISPGLDRYTDPVEIKSEMKKVAVIYDLFGKPNHFLFETPLEINRMTGAMEEEITGFFSVIINNKTE